MVLLRAGHLWLAVNVHGREGWDTVSQDRGVVTLQAEGKTPPLEPEDVLLILPCVPGKGPGQPPNHPDRLLPLKNKHHHLDSTRDASASKKAVSLHRDCVLDFMDTCKFLKLLNSW